MSLSLQYALVFETGSWQILKVLGATSSWQRGEEMVSTATWKVSVQRRAPAHSLAVGAVLLTGALLLLTAAALPPAQRPALAACSSFTAALW